MKMSEEKKKALIHIAGRVAGSPYFIGGVLGATVFAADQLFKSSIEMQDDANFPHDPATNKRSRNFEFDKKHNEGLCCGALKRKPDLVTALTAAGMAVAGTSLALRRREDSIGKISDMVVMGGAASNLYDRVKRGYVVDYLHVKKGPLSKIVFNIADAAIALGALAGSASRTVVELKHYREDEYGKEEKN